MSRALIVDTETLGLVPELGGTAFCCAAGWDDESKVTFFDFREPGETERFRRLMDEAETIVAHNANFDCRQLIVTMGLSSDYFASKKVRDTLLMAKHRWPQRGRFSLDALTPRVPGLPDKDIALAWLKANAGRGNSKRYDLLPDEVLIPYASADVARCRLLWNQLKHADLDANYHVDEELVPIVLQTELRGVAVDWAHLRGYEDAQRIIMADIQKRTPFKLFGPGSRAALEVKFAYAAEKYGCKNPEYMEGGRGSRYRLDDAALRLFMERGVEWADEVCRVRYAMKMVGYTKSWRKFEEVGRLYPSYRISEARTSRMSCRNPGVQQVPKRKDATMRQCVVPDPGQVFLVADYDRMEDFGAALASGDEAYLRACQDGDLHANVASLVFGKPVERVTPQEREGGKTLNHAIKYGAQARTVARNLSKILGRSIHHRDAQEYIDRYWSSFPTFRAWADANQRFAQKGLPGKDPFGRAQWAGLKSHALTNYIIQGWCAGIMKRAVLKLARYGLTPWLYLHDELGIQVPAGSEEGAAKLMKRAMEEHDGFRFPVGVSLCRRSWGAKEEIEA